MWTRSSTCSCALLSPVQVPCHPRCGGCRREGQGASGGVGRDGAAKARGFPPGDPERSGAAQAGPQLGCPPNKTPPPAHPHSCGVGCSDAACGIAPSVTLFCIVYGAARAPISGPCVQVFKWENIGFVVASLTAGMLCAAVHVEGLRALPNPPRGFIRARVRTGSVNRTERGTTVFKKRPVPGCPRTSGEAFTPPASPAPWFRADRAVASHGGRPL